MKRVTYRVTVLALLVTLATITAVTTTSGHLKAGGIQYVSGNMIDDESGVPLDPINIVFKGDNRKVDPETFLGLWNGGGQGGSMVDQGCGGDHAFFYRHPRDRDPEEDDEWHTHFCDSDKNHIRIFDSKEHDDAHHSLTLTRDRWAVAGVHHDDFHWETRCERFVVGGECTLVPTDSIDLNWEIMERRARKQLSELCAWSNSLHLKGSGPDFQGFFSNGKATRISPKRDSEPGPCA